MAEPPAPPAQPEIAAAATAPPPGMRALQVDRADLTVRDLLEAGVHFGHQTRRWNPRMKRFLFGERNGVHIVDLDQTLPRFQKALEFLRDTVGAGGKVLFVSTKRQAQAFVEAEAQRSEQFYVSRRWLGGMLTNFKTVRKSIERYKELLELVADEQKVAEISKKELSGIQRWIEKYKKSLDGIREMTRLPDALFVVDVRREAIAVKEAIRLGIPIVAVVDSNCDPGSIDFVVPGNDDSTRAIHLYCQRVADACLEGAMLYNERVQSEVAEAEQARGPLEVGDKTGTGRVVVEIKQQPRRGRGTHTAKPRGGDSETRAERDTSEGTSGTGAAVETPASSE